MSIVAKPFNTPQRRFLVDAEVNETDDVSPHSFVDLKSRGFIVEKVEEKSAPPPSFNKRPVVAASSQTD